MEDNLLTFEKWLEVVAGRKITTNQPVEILFIDPEEDWELAGQVETIARQVNIRPMSNKDVSIIAQVGDQVIGGIIDAFYNDDSWGELARTYDFDVVVDPQWQGYQKVGFQLINAALEHAQQSDAVLVRAYVVNTRLINVLKSRYGFDGSSGREDRPDVLYKWL